MVTADHHAVLAIVAGIAFYAVEAKSSEPMLPLGLFRIQNFSPALVFGMIVNLTYYGMIFVLSLYLQQVRGLSPLLAGVCTIPIAVMTLILAPISGRGIKVATLVTRPA